jgi:purine-binding chemotaxis protein CheW
VREIIEYGVLTRVPMLPAWIRGVINLRGNVVPVVDLAVKFNLRPSPVTKRSCIVIVEVNLSGERVVIGITADTVREVMDLLPQDIEPPPPFGTRVQANFLLGLGKLGRKFVLILDIGAVLSVQELAQAASAVEAADGDAAPPPVSQDSEGNEESHELVAAGAGDARTGQPGDSVDY